MPHRAFNAEFDWLKVVALCLLIVVHSDFYFVFPDIILPIQWFMLSVFFFVSGFLAFNSFRKREASIRNFLKSKFLSLYVPFMIACVFYFVLETTTGNWSVDPLRLASHVSMLNMFDSLNSLYNWSFLWFIPCLLVFMLILCFLEKFVKKAKFQVLVVSFVWLCTLLAWAYDTPMKLVLDFSQYFLVFMIGFWLNKLKMYESIMKFRTTLITVPCVALFSLNFSNLFSFNSAIEALKSLLYSNGRSIVLTLSAVFLSLLFLRKWGVSRNRFVGTVSSASVFIYLVEPFVSYLLRFFVFGQYTIYIADGLGFYLYQAARIVVLLAVLPLTVNAIGNTCHNGFPSKMRVIYKYKPFLRSKHPGIEND